MHLLTSETLSFQQEKQDLALISPPQWGSFVSRKMLPDVRGIQVHMDIVKLRQKVKIRKNGHMETKSKRRETQDSLL